MSQELRNAIEPKEGMLVYYKYKVWTIRKALPDNRCRGGFAIYFKNDDLNQVVDWSECKIFVPDSENLQHYMPII